MRTKESLSGLVLVAWLAAPIAPAVAGQDQEKDPQSSAEQQAEEQEAQQSHRERMEQHMEEMERRKAARQTQQQAPGQGENVDVSIPVQEASAGDLAAQPRLYYGDVVQVSAEIEEVFGNQSFTLDEERLFAGPDVVVLLPRQPAAELPQGERVRVVGHVRPLVMTEFERDYDWFDLNLFSDWYDQMDLEIETRVRPVIIASSITTDDGRELVEAMGTIRTDVPTQRPRTDRPGMGRMERMARPDDPQQWDTNGDNRIGPEEWTEAHFSAWDENGDGMLDQSEWNRIRNARPFADMDVGEFSDWDENGDNQLDQDEFGGWIEDNAWDEWDEDGDGFLSFDEARPS